MRWDLMEIIHKEFYIELDGFCFETFFYTVEEAYAPYWVLVLMLKKKRALTIAHLLRVAERRRWFDPE
jgi:hypothetical protein